MSESNESKATDVSTEVTPSQRLQQKYFQLCAELGNLRYTQKIHEDRITQILTEMQSVNRKGARLNESEPKETSKQEDALNAH